MQDCSSIRLYRAAVALLTTEAERVYQGHSLLPPPGVGDLAGTSTPPLRADARVRKILESGELGSVFRAPVLTTDAPLRATLQRLDAMDGSDVLPSSAAKVERAKLLFERCAALCSNRSALKPY